MEEKNQEQKKIVSGIPMSEESYEEWQKSFEDIEESIEGLSDDN